MIKMGVCPYTMLIFEQVEFSDVAESVGFDVPDDHLDDRFA